MRSPTPAFRQSGSLTGSLLALTAGQSVQITASSRISACPLLKTPTSPILQLLDESSPSKEKAVLLKRRRVEVGGEAVGNEEPTRYDPELAAVAPEGGIALGTETAPL